MSEERKRVLIVGGLGVVGKVLTEGFGDSYDLIVGDLPAHQKLPSAEYIQLDVSDYRQLTRRIPKGIEAIINVAGIRNELDIHDHRGIESAAEVYLKGSYNLFLAAVKLGVKRAILASTNHVTDSYEQDGHSRLGREITTEDYPRPEGIYGAMKLYAESTAYAFSRKTSLSVICLRIGTVREKERELLRKDPRASRTILSHVDLINLFRSAIESTVKFGVYYGVSDNPGRPWSIKNAIDELGFHPQVNSIDLRQEMEKGRRGG
jgi:nucleoside-diphosphate-sugar epimerase